MAKAHSTISRHQSNIVFTGDAAWALSKAIPIPHCGCWLWMGALNGKSGYGVPGVRSCVNPDHLEPVTRAENLRRAPRMGVVPGQKKECPRGHSYSEQNGAVRTRSNGRTYLSCRICDAARVRARRDSPEAMAYRLDWISGKMSRPYASVDWGSVARAIKAMPPGASAAFKLSDIDVRTAATRIGIFANQFWGKGTYSVRKTEDHVVATHRFVGAAAIAAFSDEREQA